MTGKADKSIIIILAKLLGIKAEPLHILFVFFDISIIALVNFDQEINITGFIGNIFGFYYDIVGITIGPCKCLNR